MTDERLNALLLKAPKNSIILLEDIDSALCDTTTTPPDPALDMLLSHRKNDDRLTFSGLLNAIDGVASQEGRLLFMTTNHKELLRPALIRPGRVDFKVEFDFVDNEQAKKLFSKFYHNTPDMSEADVGLHARRFSEKLHQRREQLTPAMIQGHLMRFKGRPQDAVSNVQSLWEDS